jgi:hypothetical protein
MVLLPAANAPLLLVAASATHDTDAAPPVVVDWE